MSDINEPDHVYLDMMAYNYENETANREPLLRFNQTRNIPLLRNTNKYKLSVVRFQMDTFNLPVYEAEITPNQSDPDAMIDSVTLVCDNGTNTYTSQKYLQWVPQNKSLPVPAAPDTQDNGLQVESDYYNCDNFSYYIYLINRALLQAITQINTDASISCSAPFLKWNPSNNTASVYVEKDFFDINITPSALTPQIKLYFNENLFSHLSSYIHLNYGSSAANGTNRELLFIPRGINETTISTVDYIILDQEYSTIETWSPISSILFTTSSLPVTNTNIARPVIYINNSLLNSNGNNSDVAKIITDLQTNEMNYKPNILYYPSAEYRFVDMDGQQTLNTIDIQVFYRNKRGVLREISLPPGASASIKILFKKK